MGESFLLAERTIASRMHQNWRLASEMQPYCISQFFVFLLPPLFGPVAEAICSPRDHCALTSGTSVLVCDEP
jgi:hypothetical protein